MLTIARERAPNAEFRKESFVGVDFPPCVAIATIGEVLNYQFDPDNRESARRSLFERAFQALEPGGLLLFDVADAHRIARSPQHVFVEQDEWSTFVEATKDAETLARRITAFRRVGDLYRRSHEVHSLDLVDASEIAETLEHVGFRVTPLKTYDAVPLPNGLNGFLATKP